MGKCAHVYTWTVCKKPDSRCTPCTVLPSAVQAREMEACGLNKEHVEHIRTYTCRLLTIQMLT